VEQLCSPSSLQSQMSKQHQSLHREQARREQTHQAENLLKPPKQAKKPSTRFLLEATPPGLLQRRRRGPSAVAHTAVATNRYCTNCHFSGIAAASSSSFFALLSPSPSLCSKSGGGGENDRCNILQNEIIIQQPHGEIRLARDFSARIFNKNET